MGNNKKTCKVYSTNIVKDKYGEEFDKIVNKYISNSEFNRLDDYCKQTYRKAFLSGIERMIFRSFLKNIHAYTNKDITSYDVKEEFERIGIISSPDQTNYSLNVIVSNKIVTGFIYVDGFQTIGDEKQKSSVLFMSKDEQALKKFTSLYEGFVKKISKLKLEEIIKEANGPRYRDYYIPRSSSFSTGWIF